MTLNVTVLTPVAIYQSADFRLIDPSSRQIVSNTSPKSISLGYKNWNGVATYTGLGQWEGRSVSEHLATWLTGNSEYSMAEVAEITASKTSQLLARVGAKTGQVGLAHTVTLAGFEDAVARVIVISNFEDCFGNVRDDVDEQLTISRRDLRGAQRSLVIVTGQRHAVSSSERRAVKRLAAKHPTDGMRVRDRLHLLNERASQRAPDTISKDCAVASCGNGQGMLALDRQAENPAAFPSISQGMNLGEMLNDALRSLGLGPGDAQVVASAYTSSRAGGGGEAQTACTMSIVEVESGYRLTEISSADFEVQSPGGQNDAGVVVGTARLSPDTPQSIPWRWDGDIIRALDFAGGAIAINAGGDVAGNSNEGGRVILVKGDAVHELNHYHGEPGVFAGSGGSAVAINDRGEVAGQAQSQAEEQGRPNTRPALYRRGQSTLVAIDVPCAFGSGAVDINDAGLVLASAHLAIFDSRAVLWTPATASWQYVGDPSANVSAIALASDGTVLAQAKNQRGHPVALLALYGKPWRRLGTEDGWAPVDINEHGEVAGYATVERLHRPWLRTATGKLIWLPYVRHHHTQPTAINASGQILGIAQADHGSHVLVWRPRAATAKRS